MKSLLLLFVLTAFLLLSFKTIFKQKNDDDLPVYAGSDLGVTYAPSQTLFKVWSPGAAQVQLRLYEQGEGGPAIETIAMTKAANGIWEAVVKGDIKNRYYTFKTLIAGKWSLECPDIYARAVGINGKRGMVVDLPSTNPVNWATDKKPALKNFTDVIIYETHIRDLSIAANSGIKHKGKYLGLAQAGTKSPDGAATGLSHLKQLGVTHVHLLPAFDFNSVDEAKTAPQYNWGYDPLNYNVPEGSYATNASDGRVRINEFKQMVQALHRNGLRVILDVVYNHTSDIANANFTQFAPGYFYRHNADGSYANGTACGNETASERPMMRKFMIESVLYWAREYHLDGFRFDLMGIHDIETMNAISDALHKVDPTIFIYGEGWTAGASPLPENMRAVKKNTPQLNGVAAFSDDFRDGLHGPYNDVKVNGFVSGALGTAESVKFGIVGATHHPQVNYGAVNYSKEAWAKQPSQCINYASCHDDNTLFDRLRISNPNATEAELIKMDKLANAAVLTAQGVAFLHAGAEMLRTKKGVANSYNSPDSINELDWSRKTKYKDVFNYYQGMVALRRHHPAFRMPDTKMIQQHLEFFDTKDDLLIGYQIKDNANGDTWKDIVVYLNGSSSPKTITLPPGNWTLAANENGINEKGIAQIKTSQLTIAGTAAYVLFRMK